MQPPEVSVVIPTHNRRETLTSAMDSVLDQRSVDLEIVVVDDGSDDGTWEMLESLDDPRVRAVRVDHRAGAAAARNLGVEQARADLIAFQDSDDLWHPDKLRLQLDRLRDTQADFCLCMVELIDVDGSFLEVKPSRQELAAVERGAFLDAIIADNFVSTPTLLISREAFDAVGGFDATLRRFQDWDLGIRLARRRVAIVERVLVTALRRPGSITASDDLLADALEALLDRHAEHFARHPRHRAMRLRQISRHRRLSRTQRARSAAEIARISPGYIASSALHRVTRWTDARGG